MTASLRFDLRLDLLRTCRPIALSLGLLAGLAQAEAPPVLSLPPPSTDRLTTQAVYQVLLGEIALRRGQPDVAFAAWESLANSSQDVDAIRRALEIGVATRQYPQSLPLARRWLNLQPDSTEARQTLNALLNLTGKLDELAPQLSEAIANDREHRGEAFLQLGRNLNRPGQSIAALSLVQTLAAPYPKLPEAHFAIAVAAERAGQLDLALSALQEARKLRPEWAQPWMLEAQLRLRGEPDKAIGLMQSYLKEYASPIGTIEGRETRLHLARLLVNANRYNEARQQFQDLSQQWPQDPDLRYPVAVLSLQMNDGVTARQELEHIVQMAASAGTAGAPSTAVYAADAHYFLGQLDEQSQPDSALAHYRQVTQGEHWLESRLKGAQLLARQGDITAARLFLRPPAGAKLKPAAQTRLTLAEAALLKASQSTGQAQQVLNNALQDDPDNTELLYEAAMLAESQGQLNQMESQLRRVLKRQPDNALALNALGYSLADHHRKLPEARRLVSRALELQPGDPYIQDSLGWVLFREGKFAEAHAQLAEAYARKPDPEIAAHLGEALWRLQRQDEARSVWQNALGQHPDNVVLREAVGRLAPALLKSATRAP